MAVLQPLLLSWIFLTNFTNAAVDPSSIKTVHVIASNHLDVGFTDYIVNVVNEYWDFYFPAVQSLKSQFASSDKMRFQYLTHSWLIQMYLECPPNAGLHCPNNTEQQSFVSSLLQDKTLSFHAFPFNSQNELYDALLFEYGLYFSTQYLPSLISAYSNTTYAPPTVMSQRDVPGITRSVIPLLNKYNVSAISIGCNGQTAPPSISPNRTLNDINLSQIFVWRDNGTNTSVLTMIHKGGYGGINVRDAVLIEGYDEAVLFDWNTDNHGPYQYTQYQQQLQQIQSEFPSANVLFSTLEDYVNNLFSRPDIINTLPIITDEIDDSWQYGANADPKKLAKFRIAQNLRRQYLESGRVSLQSPTFFNFSRFLLKNGEHTFGISHARWNVSANAWSNAQLDAAIQNGNSDIKENINSWDEQRRFGIDYAMEALAESNDANEMSLYQDIVQQYEYIDNVVQPEMSDWSQIQNISQIFTVNGYEIQFNGITGALNRLYSTERNIDYINSTGNGNDDNIGFGLFLYQTRTEPDFNDWYTFQYGWFGNGSNCSRHGGYCKNGLQENANPLHQNLRATLLGLYGHNQDKNVFMVEMDMGKYQSELKEYYGGCSRMYSIYNFSLNENRLDIQLILINKTLTRIPENLWMIFNANLNYQQCAVTKLGSAVDVNSVMLNGTKHLHVIEPDFDNAFVTCSIGEDGEDGAAVSVQGFDSGNIGFVPEIDMNGDDYSTFPVPLNVSNNLGKGFGFVLFNNVWNTNYPYWTPFDVKDTNSTARFQVMLH